MFLKVSLSLFASDTTQDASDTNLGSVEIKLQKSINEISHYLIGTIKMLWYFTQWEQSRCYLLWDKNIKFCQLTLSLNLRATILSKFLSTGILTLLLMMRSIGNHTLLMYAKQYQEIYSCNSGSNTLWILNSKCKLFYHAHISPYFIYASTVWDGCNYINVQMCMSIFYNVYALPCTLLYIKWQLLALTYLWTNIILF